MIKKLKVKHMRYWETSRGLLGYEAKTKEGSIWNDGMGGLLILNHYILSTIRKIS